MNMPRPGQNGHKCTDMSSNQATVSYPILNSTL